MNSQSHRIEYFLLCLTFFAQFVGNSLISILVGAIFITLVFRLNLVEKIFIFAMGMSTTLGAFLYSIGIGGMGGYVYIIAILFVLYGLLSKRIIISNFSGAITPLLFILLYLSFSVFSSEGGNYANSKLSHTLIIGFVSILSFSVLFSNKNKVRQERLGLYFLLMSYLTLIIAIKVNNISGPSSIFDVGYLRSQTVYADIHNEIERYRISYHMPGALALQAFGLFISARKFSISNVKIFTLLCAVAILYAGARQSIVIFFIMIVIYFFNDLKMVFSSKAFLMMPIVLAIVYLTFDILIKEDGLFYSIINEGLYSGSGRESNYERAIGNFLSNPILGIGYGRDNVNGVYNQYAHNIFLELLGELGLLGFIFISVVVLTYYKRYNQHLKCMLILFLAYFGPALFSNGFDSNIKTLTFIFALATIIPNKNRILN